MTAAEVPWNTPVSLYCCFKSANESDMGVVEDIEPLIQKAVSGDAEAFGRLYDVNADRVYRHIYYRVGNTQDAEDLTQEVFLKAWEAIGRYRVTASPFLAWLMRISHNLIVDLYRRKKKHIYLSDDYFAADPDAEAISSVGVDFDRRQLRQAILQLPGNQQQVILMRFSEGYSYAEIASSLEKSEGAIRVLQFRALKRLRSILEKETSR